ncbi:hypothetical protein KCP69_27000 (plasmid) [Salmonella enterica subsp. enterica]|nr:hypothetical protein KCP69_27000 [Salmonella enterica subsp. enterica]
MMRSSSTYTCSLAPIRGLHVKQKPNTVSGSQTAHCHVIVTVWQDAGQLRKVPLCLPDCVIFPTRHPASGRRSADFFQYVQKFSPENLLIYPPEEPSRQD